MRDFLHDAPDASGIHPHSVRGMSGLAGRPQPCAGLLGVALCVGRGMAADDCFFGVCNDKSYRTTRSKLKHSQWGVICTSCTPNSKIISTSSTDIAVVDTTLRCNHFHIGKRYAEGHCCLTADYCLCKPGYYKTGGLCQQCAQGTYSNAYGATACTPCPAEQWSWPGATSCGACSHPYFSPSNGKPGNTMQIWDHNIPGCLLCSSGWYVQNKQCFLCPKDQYAYDKGVDQALGLEQDERVAGYIYIGSAAEKPPERPRATLDEVHSQWVGPS